MEHGRASLDERPCPLGRAEERPGVFFRRLHRQGKSLVVALPPAVRRALDVECGEYLRVQVDASGSVTLDVVRGATADEAGSLPEPARAARLARRVVRLERQLARAAHRYLTEGFFLGLMKTGTAPQLELAAFLRDYRAGRVLVLPVETQPPERSASL